MASGTTSYALKRSCSLVSSPYLKSMFSRAPLDVGETLTDAVADSMATIQEDRALVRSFFGNPEVAYVKQAISW